MSETAPLDRTRPGPDPDPLTIDVDVAAAAWRDDLGDVEALAAHAAKAALGAALEGSDSVSVHISILLADDAFVAGLNQKYRGKSEPTNVLSFAGEEAGGPRGAGAPRLLGDVVLAYETVAREAAAQEKPLGDHFCHLVVHGILHLLGYDHQHDEEAALMERTEIDILRSLGVPDPYRPLDVTVADHDGA